MDQASPSRSAIPPIGATKTVTTRDGRISPISRSAIRTGRSSSTIMADPAAGSRRASSQIQHRSIGCDSYAWTGPASGQSSPQKTRTYAGWADDLITIADALGHHEFGVTGWSEGGPWALAAAAYIDPASTAPRQQHRGRKLRNVRRQLGSGSAFQSRRAGRIPRPAFRARLPPHVCGPWPDRRTLPRDLRQAIAESRQRLRSPDPASTGFRNRLLRSKRRMLRSRQRRAGSRQRAPLSALGFRRDEQSNGRSTCGRDWMIGLSRLPSTRRWPTGCPERCGIRSREPAFRGCRLGRRGVRDHGRGTRRLAPICSSPAGPTQNDGPPNRSVWSNACRPRVPNRSPRR